MLCQWGIELNNRWRQRSTPQAGRVG